MDAGEDVVVTLDVPLLLEAAVDELAAEEDVSIDDVLLVAPGYDSAVSTFSAVTGSQNTLELGAFESAGCQFVY